MKDLLRTIKTVAVIGCSSNPYRTSHHIASYLQDNGIRVIPINPNESEVLGEKTYDTILDLPEGLDIDIVNIFRNKRFTREMVEEIVEWSESTEQKPVVWTQLDVSTDSARKLAEDHGLEYVENRCLMVEHRRMS